MTATFDREILCPFCGERILLAECPIVATNPLVMARLRDELSAEPVADALVPPSGSDHLTEEDILSDVGGSEDPPAPPPPAPVPSAPPSEPDRRRSQPPAFSVGQDLVSTIDQEARVVVAPPPDPPEEPEGRRFWQANRAHLLPSAIQLAAEHGGSRIRPARACPQRSCHHPLPVEIDDRDPFVVELVGNSSASKTTLLAALVEMAERPAGRERLGLLEFTMSERTTRLLRQVNLRYRRRERTDATQVEAIKTPLDFAVTMTSHPDDPIVLIVNDIPGETYMDPDMRALMASHIQWADCIAFVINPQEAPSINTWESDVDQATLLNGIRSDLSQVFEASSHATADRYPPLVAIVAKADVLAREGVLGVDDRRQEAISSALRKVGADDVVDAVEAWPRFEWGLAAALPDEGPPTGIVEVFSSVLRAMTSR